ncbi:MAG: hypothetical protein DYG94_03220 [Leptolyngbya sp. PLA3]|nr:MAG: hypothetical protein EDM82_11080 [Cyanobacteria bacterium CYA]MCE7967741.1 hypothetical protein [Leptolyngbya sp. PL-A3]
MKQPRLIAWTGLSFSLLALGVGAWTMGRRIAAYNREHPREHPYFIEVGVTDFEFAGREVTVRDQLDAEGAGQVVVDYGPDSASIDVGVPNPLPLPGLARHEDWLRVLIVGEPGGRTYEQFRQAVRDRDITPRLVFVSRHLNPGVDDSRFGIEVDQSSREYGEVMRKRWTFGFLELRTEGGFRQWTRHYPESARSFDGRVLAAARAGQPAPQRSPDELAEDSWEWYAALTVIPAGKAPNRSFRNDALSSAGWALPMTSAGVIGSIGCLAFALAPRRSDRWSAAERPSP